VTTGDELRGQGREDEEVRVRSWERDGEDLMVVVAEEVEVVRRNEKRRRLSNCSTFGRVGLAAIAALQF